MPKYTTEKDPEKSARAFGYELHCSPKDSMNLAYALRGMKVEPAKKYLEDIIAMKRALPTQYHKKKRPHKKGMGPGSYPKKAASYLLRVLENAENNAEYKGVWIRLVAALIDFVILDIIGTIIHYSVGHVVAIPSFILPIYGLVYFVGFWWWRGQTPGKMIIGARVVRTDGRPVGVDRAFLRYLFYLVPLFAPITFLANSVTIWLTYILPIVGLVVTGLTRQKRGIHDLIAGTCVINTRVRLPEPEEVEAVATAEPEQGDDSPPDTQGRG
jgi:ribosomal protein uL22